MATKDECFCKCGYPASRTSAFRARHMKRWLDQLVDDCLPDAIEGRDYSATLAPYADLFEAERHTIRPMFHEALEKRVRIARRGWDGQAGEILDPFKVSWLTRRLRQRYWTGNDVTHATYGPGRVWKVLDQAAVRVRFEHEPGLLDVPTAELRKVGVQLDDEEGAYDE